MHGEEIIETEAIECEVDDFDVLCAYIRDFEPSFKSLVIYLWFSEDEDVRSDFLRGIMELHGEEIKEFFRNRALDAAFQGGKL